MASSDELSDQKRRLIENAERYREAIAAEMQNVKAATAWVPRTVGVMRATSPLIALAAPVIGLLLRRKKKHSEVVHHAEVHQKNGKSEKGMVAKALFVFEILRKAKPFWEHFQRTRERRAESSRARAAARAK